MNYKLHIQRIGGIIDIDIQSGTSKQECLDSANRCGYQLFDIVKQEAVIEEVTEEDGTIWTKQVVDENGMPVYHDVTYPATHTFNWGNIEDIKAKALEEVSRACVENRRKKYMSDEAQINALAGIYEACCNPRMINGQVLSKMKAVEIINAHRDFFYAKKVELDLCTNIDEIAVVLDNLILP